MTDERELTSALHAWLNADAHEDSGSVLETVLAGLRDHPQRGRAVPARLARTGLTAWGLGAAAALAVVALGAILVLPSILTGPGQTGSPPPPTASSPVFGGETPSPLPTQSSVPSASVPATVEPTNEPTNEPTTGPTPVPTLNWADNGFSASVKSPVAIGAKARVTLKGPVGPTCKLSITYPSGIKASLPSPTHPAAGSWQWTWTVPTKAHAGTADGTATCTYGGVPKSGPVSFKIVDPALPGGWDFEAAMPASRSSSDTGVLAVPVTIKGTMPIDPGYATQHVYCTLDLQNGSNVAALQLELLLDVPITAFTANFDVGALGSGFVGTATWTMRCRNLTVTGSTFQSDSGTIVIN